VAVPKQAMLAKISSADLVQTNGLGLSLANSTQRVADYATVIVRLCYIAG
jgi:hypothetical protein